MFDLFSIGVSYTLSREYRVVRYRYSRLLFTSEDRLCANLRVQEQSTNMTSQCQCPHNLNGISFLLLLRSLWWVHIVGYVLASRSYSYITPFHYHHCVNLSEDIELINMPVRYILSSVWVRLSIFSLLSIIQYMGMCVFSLPIPLWWLREYIFCLIIIIN